MLTAANPIPASTLPPLINTANRIRSVDLLRGLVMIIMALDHTRDYFHWTAFQFDPMDMERTTPAIFLTRWITHFCAPTFVFLAGTSAWFVSRRRSIKALSWFLFSRGAWLVLLEVTVVNFGWFFNYKFPGYGLQVIWALGMSMIALAGLVWLPRVAIAAIGLVMVLGHNAFDAVHLENNVAWAMLHDGGFFMLPTGQGLFFLYPLVPWIGVMALGFCFGTLYTDFDAAKRKRILFQLGIGSIALFLVLRSTNLYGDAELFQPDAPTQIAFMSFLNVTKYPPSLLFLLMTIGPGFLFLAFAEKAKGKIVEAVSVFGRVPLFYYVAHLFLIHSLAMLAAEFTGFDWRYLWEMNNFVTNVTELQGYGFPLWGVYLVWILVVALLYPACRWYDAYKMRNKRKVWLSYL